MTLVFGFSHPRPLGGTQGDRTFNQLQDAFELWARGAQWIWHNAVLDERGLRLGAIVHPKGRVSAIVIELVASVCTQYREPYARFATGIPGASLLLQAKTVAVPAFSLQPQRGPAC